MTATIPTPASRRTVVIETTGLLLSDRATGRPAPAPQTTPEFLYCLVALDLTDTALRAAWRVR